MVNIKKEKFDKVIKQAIQKGIKEGRQHKEKKNFLKSKLQNKSVLKSQPRATLVIHHHDNPLRQMFFNGNEEGR
jgi:hypothetical protein